VVSTSLHPDLVPWFLDCAALYARQSCVAHPLNELCPIRIAYWDVTAIRAFAADLKQSCSSALPGHCFQPPPLPISALQGICGDRWIFAGFISAGFWLCATKITFEL